MMIPASCNSLAFKKKSGNKQNWLLGYFKHLYLGDIQAFRLIPYITEYLQWFRLAKQKKLPRCSRVKNILNLLIPMNWTNDSPTCTKPIWESASFQLLVKFLKVAIIWPRWQCHFNPLWTTMECYSLLKKKAKRQWTFWIFYQPCSRYKDTSTCHAIT